MCVRLHYVAALGLLSSSCTSMLHGAACASWCILSWHVTICTPARCSLWQAAAELVCCSIIKRHSRGHRSGPARTAAQWRHPQRCLLPASSAAHSRPASTTSKHGNSRLIPASGTRSLEGLLHKRRFMVLHPKLARVLRRTASASELMQACGEIEYAMGKRGQAMPTSVVW